MAPLASRKFKPLEFYSSPSIAYYLLPFRFHRLNDSREILVNEVGDYIVAPIDTARRIAAHDISPSESIYADLVANFFISEKPIPDLIDILATRYRTKKSFLDDFTSLHIFVITLRCDHTCHYCQVSRQSEDKHQYDMSRTDIDGFIDLMFKSPSRDVTVEFQGGEPLLVFDNIVYAVKRIEELNRADKRRVRFVVCTNLSNINLDILTFLKEHGILISTSYDGPEFIHNSNRTFSRGNSHATVLEKIGLCREILGNDMVSALMTASSLTLNYPVEIVDDYVAQGLPSIFLRQINPYGFAKKNRMKNAYTAEQFLEFYKTALQHIINLNLRGLFFLEEFATIILSKILTPFPIGFTDLQSPNGMINGAIVYNYDGFVYASDESRMLAEERDFTFQLGHVKSDSYQKIFYGAKAQHIAKYWANESLAGCSECGFQSYCGADPVRHYATQGDLAGYRPTSSFCITNMEIIRFLIELLTENRSIERVFRSWVNKTPL